MRLSGCQPEPRDSIQDFNREAGIRCYVTRPSSSRHIKLVKTSGLDVIQCTTLTSHAKHNNNCFTAFFHGRLRQKQLDIFTRSVLNRGLAVFSRIQIVVLIIQQNMNSSANKQICGFAYFDKYCAVLMLKLLYSQTI